MRSFIKILIVILAGIVSGILCWILGAYIGGNYALNFRFMGVRGYEAMGLLGLILGIIGGSGLFWYILFKPFRNRSG